ncbi:methyltransferase domain-containing protein [Kitasatospora sp. NPDC087315]|uniref:class I SAM-dependent methyltransferase n=1 Tax=Kitasatospora sp. NPDC087315 TaxID=3364069 RepID=UPI00381A7229
MTSQAWGRAPTPGCEPGHITAHLDEPGLAAFGVDASAVMIKSTQQAYPGLRFDVGSMAALNIADGVLGGALSRWSVIHTPHTAERCINKIRAWRGLATSYDKTPASYMAGLQLRGSIVWMRSLDPGRGRGARSADRAPLPLTSGR